LASCRRFHGVIQTDLGALSNARLFVWGKRGAMKSGFENNKAPGPRFPTAPKAGLPARSFWQTARWGGEFRPGVGPNHGGSESLAQFPSGSKPRRPPGLGGEGPKKLFAFSRTSFGRNLRPVLWGFGAGEAHAWPGGRAISKQGPDRPPQHGRSGQVPAFGLTVFCQARAPDDQPRNQPGRASAFEKKANQLQG